jgi:hypothetical protein
MAEAEERELYLSLGVEARKNLWNYPADDHALGVN